MTPKFLVILEQAIVEGVSRGYHRSYKHTDSPAAESIITNIQECVMESLDDYFDFN